MKKTLRNLMYCSVVVGGLYGNAFAVPLQNGGSVDGFLATGVTVSYTFDGIAGERFSIQAVDTGSANQNITPFLHVYNPDRSLLDSNADGSVARLINLEIEKTGRYTVNLSDDYGYGNSTGSGPYTIHLARAPDANEGGVIQNGSSRNGTLTLGDIDTYTFQANADDHISIQVADTGDGQMADIRPHLHVYKPDGSLLDSSSDNSVARLINLQVDETGTYTIQIIDDYGYGGGSGIGPYVSLSCTGICGDIAPSAPIGISPAEALDDSTPEYQWYAVSNATWYYLRISNSQGVLHQKWYSADDAGCGSGSGTCEVTPNVSVSGNASWRVYGWNSTGSGPWSTSLAFNVRAGVPEATTLISPAATGSAQPTFTWERVAEASWYYQWISHNGTSYKKWYSESDANCDASTCSVTPSLSLSGAVTWWVRTWNTSGNGGWSSSMRFTVSAGVPGKATLYSPSGSNAGVQPTFQWSAVADVTWYQLWVNDSTGTPIKKWYTRAQAGCASGTGTCRVTANTVLSGNATWWIQTWSSSGNGPWSNGLSFVP
jgi:hypothetical protein